MCILYIYVYFALILDIHKYSGIWAAMPNVLFTFGVICLSLNLCFPRCISNVSTMYLKYTAFLFYFLDTSHQQQ